MDSLEFLRKIEEDHVEPALYLAQESLEEVNKKQFQLLGFRGLTELENDAWKRVQHVDENIRSIRTRIREVRYRDDMTPEERFGLATALNDYIEDILEKARTKLTDQVIRTITDRQKAVLQNMARRVSFVSGGPGDEEE